MIRAAHPLFWLLAPVMALGACATGEPDFVVRAEHHEAPGLPGLPQTVQAARYDGRWRIDRSSTPGVRSGRRLSAAASAELDQALASPALYAPVPRGPDDCLDPPLKILEITAQSATRRLVFECDMSGEAGAIFRLLGTE